MKKPEFAAHITAGAALALAFTFTAQAQTNRTFVATTGNDANACSVTAPCRTLTAALAATSPGGEIVVLNSGGYGPATISRPVTITAIGVDASITATSGTALSLLTAGNVTITGLNLHGSGAAGSIGVVVETGGDVHLYNMQIDSFETGVLMTGGSQLSIHDSKLTHCNSFGLDATDGITDVHHTVFDSNGSPQTQSVVQP
jgi:hypothetical protein